MKYGACSLQIEAAWNFVILLPHRNNATLQEIKPAGLYISMSKNLKKKPIPIAWPLTAEAVGLSNEKYSAALLHLFDRPVPSGGEQEWYWNDWESEFVATPLQWTRIQAVLFANAGDHLKLFNNEQVGMGLNYLMNSAVSDVSVAAMREEVSVEEAMLMMRAMPSLWRDCIGPRLAHLHEPIGSCAEGRLSFVCYMWFDEWPSVPDIGVWKEALWQVFHQMLLVPCREVQIAALHGIGHCIGKLPQRRTIEKTLDQFLRQLGSKDPELTSYVQAARRGAVQ